MRILFYIVKAVFGSIISKIITMCLLAVGSLYLAHSTGRLGPMMAMVGIESDGSFKGAVTSIGETVLERTGAAEMASAKLGIPSLSIASAQASTAPAKSAKFLEVEARISDVTRQCRLLDMRGATITRTAPMPCFKAEEMLTRDAFAGFELQRVADIAYIYYAPDGKTVLKGSFSPKSGDESQFRVGAVIDIRVDPRNPERSEPI